MSQAIKDAIARDEGDVSNYAGGHPVNEARFARLESVVEGLAHAQATHERLFSKFRDEILQAVDKLATHMHNQGKTSWPLVVTVLGLVLSFAFGSITLTITIGVMAIAPLRRQIEDHLALPGHTETRIAQAVDGERIKFALEMIKNNEEDIDEQRRIQSTMLEALASHGHKLLSTE